MKHLKNWIKYWIPAGILNAYRKAYWNKHVPEVQNGSKPLSYLLPKKNLNELFPGIDSKIVCFPISEIFNDDYMILAACDEDCSDVDITVYDEDGDTVASDVSTDDVPVVRLSPKRDGQYRIEIKMYECSSEPCYWGFGVFNK